MNDDTHATILIVDDDADNLLVLSQILQPHYRVLAARSGETGLRLASGTPRPDLILLDIMMPGLDGYDVLARLRDTVRTCDIPVVFVTALGDAADEERGFKLGANDYITKPIKPAVVLARVRTLLEAKLARDWLHDRHALLEAEVHQRLTENALAQRVGIRALALLAEAHAPTGPHQHLQRIQAYVRRLALQLRGTPGFEALGNDPHIELLALAASLHDIGMATVPAELLVQRGALTPEQRASLQDHTRRGSAALLQAEIDLETPLDVIAAAREIARSHHEKWDGSGYPDGLAGTAIPLPARLMALADAYDALTSPRVYRPQPLGHAQARELIVAGRASHFDPDVTDAFLACHDDFIGIAERYRDLAG
jgi:putative two-component system response regulator